jgi:uncharacterized membrane protein YccC
MSSFDLLKQNFNIHSNYLRYAIRLALSCGFTVALYEFLQLQSGYWIAFSVIACTQPTLGQSLQRSKNRVIGTLIGVWLGILIAHSFGSNPIYIDILLPIFIFLTFYLRAYSYVFFVLFTTIVTVLFICLIVPGDWQVGIIRLEMTLVGIIIALVATYLILPSRASNVLEQQLTEVKQSFQHFYTTICQKFSQHLEPSSMLLKPATDNDLQTAHWQTFQNLQLMLTTIQESHMEYWNARRWSADKSQLHQKFETIYQTLMILEIHLPTQITQPQLQFLIKPLDEILQEITDLFAHFDLDEMLKLNRHLTALLVKLRQLRAQATADLSIPTATLYEHIQLNIFIETLQKLLKNLAS